MNTDELDFPELAQFAIRNQKILPIDVVEKMASLGIESRSVILLLSPHLNSTLNIEQLFRILEYIDGDYSKLASKGRNQPKIPNTPENEKLLQTLQNLEVVNSFKKVGDIFKVFKKHK